jgi:threonylcarbamoyladenosine tRNA methylthiotransferase MtaB
VPEGPTHIKARRALAVKANLPGTRRLPPVRRFARHQRAFVKVQDGCDAFCTYCVVPYTRCNVWSRPLAEVVEECRGLVAAGHKEIVLTGVVLGAYGRATVVPERWPAGPALLIELVRRVARIEGLWRVRLSSLAPRDVTGELLGLWRELPNLAPHLHLPLQSGSAAVLARMGRRYTPEAYLAAVAAARRALDAPAVTTDVIVGFPGEGETQFAETLAAAREAGFCKIHAFPFSAMAGTAAWAWRGEAAPPAVVKERMARLAALERDLARAYRRRLVGRTVEAVVESPPRRSRRRGREGLAEARTPRYQRVFFPGAAAPGAVVRLRMTAVREEGLAGERA